MATGRKSVAASILGVSMLVLGGCASQSDLDAYATKAELEQLRNELNAVRDAAAAAEQNSANAAAAAQQAADDARAASEKADAIFRKSLRK